MSILIDLSGIKFGRLTVVSKNGRDKNYNTKWNCRCDCGTLVVVIGDSLKRGASGSCGCLNKELASKRAKKHGQSGVIRSREYSAWSHIKTRCYDVDYPKYCDYGGRGIMVCDRWLESFESFFEDVGPSPSEKHSIDRWPNNDGNYEPGNCRWATKGQQARNRRTSRLTESDVIAIRESKEKYKILGNKYGVSDSYIYKIKSKKLFKDI